MRGSTPLLPSCAPPFVTLPSQVWWGVQPLLERSSQWGGKGWNPFLMLLWTSKTDGSERRAYMAVTLAMEASHRCVHGNSYSFHPSPRAYGNEYELVWWFESTLCYYLVSLTIHSLHL